MSSPKKVLLTGATGFIGSYLTRLLNKSGHTVVGLGRTSPNPELGPYFSNFILCDLNRPELSTRLPTDLDCIINLAGIAHNNARENGNEELSYFTMNAVMPQRLAMLAVDSGVPLFIHLSSVKAVGEKSSRANPFDNSTPCVPETTYGRSKRQGEKLLLETLANTKARLIIIRPPIVYGPNVKGTLLQLIRIIRLGIPLPLKSSPARRSFISLQNLCSAILACLQEGSQTSGTFFVSDGPSVRIPELIDLISNELGSKTMLIPSPPALMHLLATLLGKFDVYEKLFFNLEVASKEFERQLSWRPPQPMGEGLREMVAWYKMRSH